MKYGDKIILALVLLIGVIIFLYGIAKPQQPARTGFHIGDSTNTGIYPSTDSDSLIVLVNADTVGLFAFVDDTTQLKALVSSNIKMAYLKALSSTDSVGAGWFVFEDSAYAEEVTNGGVAYGHTTAGKQWVRTEYIDNRVINVKWLGAIGDGSTDCTTPIQRAITSAAGTFEGAEVYLPAGDYVISNTITIPTYSTIRGAGIERTRLYLADNSDCDILQFGEGTAQHIYLYDFQIEGNASNQTGQSNGIIIENAGIPTCLYNVKIRTCNGVGLYIHSGTNMFSCYNFQSGYNEAADIRINNSRYIDFFGCLVTEGKGDSTYDAQILIENSSQNVAFYGLRVENDGVGGAENGVWMDGTTQCVFVNLDGYCTTDPKTTLITADNNASYSLFNVTKDQFTNMLVDSNRSITLTDADIENYVPTLSAKLLDLTENNSQMNLSDAKLVGTTSGVLEFNKSNSETGSVLFYGGDGASDVEISSSGRVKSKASIPGGATGTMSGNETFTRDDGNVFVKDPGGSNRNFNPTGGWNQSHWVIVVNTADAAETITFDSSGLNQAIAQNERGLFVYDGTNWRKVYVGN